jgi:hypothetical protein
MDDIGVFCVHLVYFAAILYILWPIWYNYIVVIFPVLVYYTKKSGSPAFKYKLITELLTDPSVEGKRQMFLCTYERGYVGTYNTHTFTSGQMQTLIHGRNFSVRADVNYPKKGCSQLFFGRMNLQKFFNELHVPGDAFPPQGSKLGDFFAFRSLF